MDFFDVLTLLGGLSLFLFGDSISTGANSSGKLGIAPYLDDWGTGVVTGATKES